MTDELEGLDAKLLRGMLPALYKKAQEGDQRSIDTVLRILQRLEKNAPTPLPSETERGFTASPAVPGQSQSRASKKEFEAFLESPIIGPNTDNKTQQSIRESIEILSDAYWRQFESGENEEKWDWRKHAYIAWSCVPKSMRYPKTLEEFADFVGLSNTSTIRKWRSKDPDIADRITALPKLLLNGHVADVLSALATVAADPIPQAHQDRKLFLEIAGVHNPKADVNLRGVVGTIELDEPLSDEEQKRVEELMREVAAQK